MLFLTYEPYRDIIEIKEEECFICYEYILNYKSSKKMSSILEYCKTCDCDVYVHVECLNKWFDIYKNCPICRKSITKNSYYVTQLLSSSNILYFIYIFCSKYYIWFLKTCYVLIFVLLLYEKVNAHITNKGNITNKINNYQENYYIDDNIFTIIINKTNNLLH